MENQELQAKITALEVQLKELTEQKETYERWYHCEREKVQSLQRRIECIKTICEI